MFAFGLKRRWQSRQFGRSPSGQWERGNIKKPPSFAMVYTSTKEQV